MNISFKPSNTSLSRQGDLPYFLETCESCIGPLASLKMIVSSNGTVVTTSSSTRLWQLLDLDQVVVQLILEASANLPDYRLQSSALAARLMMEEGDDVDIEELSECIERSAVRLDVSKMRELLSLVRTVIRPKAKASGLLTTEIETLSVKIVEAWLRTLPDQPDTGLGEMVVKVLETGGSEDIMTVQGLLYPHQPTYDDFIEDMRGPIRVVVYDTMLDTHQTEDWEDKRLEYDLEAEASWGPVDVLSRVSSLGVRLVACQKVVSWPTRRALEEAGIQVMERLGTAGRARLVLLSGARPVSSMNHQVREEDIGTLDTLNNVTVGSRNYLHLNTGTSNLVSLLLGSLGEQQAEELEAVIKRSVESLNDLVTQPQPSVLPGGGCLESCLSLQTTNRRLRRTLIKSALIPGKLNISEAFVDPEYGHLFATESSTRCQCGIVEARDLCEDKFIPALQIYTDLSLPSRTLSTREIPATGQTSLMDSFTFKKSALLTAVETAQHLSNIGMLISY